MNRYDLNAQLRSVYNRFPEASGKPVIGITANFSGGQSCLAKAYYDQIVKAGGVPFLLPPVADGALIADSLERIDALLLTGGADINPLFMGEEPSPQLHGICNERDLPELMATRLAFNRQLPMLGICRGVQTLAVALGGKVAQDLGERAFAVKHSQDADRSVATHTVSIQADTLLHSLFDSDQLAVNSFHHQAVTEAGPHFKVCAVAADGVVEAVESSEAKPIIGVQWHPECMGEEGLPLFRWLVNEAALYRQTCTLQRQTLTLDTHCDTPMLFPQGADFAQRDDRLLVDRHKMADGMLDGCIMVAYLPQPKQGQTFADVAPLPVQTPHEYADLIFDKIEQTVNLHPETMTLCNSPYELREAKKAGKKAILRGIENGLAIEKNLDFIEHFTNRGAVYITLCHNGDNDICDSARGNHTHGGVSAFGKEVIAQMNHCGLMVDLSHAGEQSFYDALEISKTPPVCSHSSCHALCPHPRNLTDDQMRALAAKGGVMQITLYPYFLRNDGNATILDAMNHLNHAVKIMGADHVGLGTDFDGDGGVPGLAHAGELMNYTRQLLLRRFSPEEITMLWGGNFLRVMERCQMASTRLPF